MLSDHRDLERMRRGFRFAAGLFEHPALRQACLEVFPSSYSERVRDWGRVSTKNLVLTTLLAGLLDGPAALRRLLVRRVISEGPTLQHLLQDDLLLDDFLRTNVHGVWHASGTCRMGADDDSHAVVDPDGRVYGVTGLRVVDASVMPCVPRANTNFPTIMVAEKMSDAILQDHGLLITRAA
jgi:5-(hydroxymethyl)furfural/furfural oxidase